MKKTMIELFAGVGGFRLGFEGSNPEWETLFANQWEPNKKNQFAYNCYENNFKGKGGIIPFSNTDISKVPIEEIPKTTVLVGGFPCQDYSVASTGAAGIQGKKGVLWWEIERIVKANKPPFILLENVDRLLKSPTNQRGRDFGIMLGCLSNLGYGVEWRVINAADFGFVQRRRRTFIFAFNKKTKYCKKLMENNTLEIITNKGIFAKKFPVNIESNHSKTIEFKNDLQKISDEFQFSFENSGLMIDGTITTINTVPRGPIRTPSVLGDVIQDNVDEKYFLNSETFPKWEYMKGGKAIERTSKEGFKYTFREGGIAFPDPLDKPARTMLTSEGSSNRSTHIIRDRISNRLRKLTPLECERINGFPDNWTTPYMTDTQTYFCMGNALVVPVVKELADEIGKIIDKEES